MIFVLLSLHLRATVLVVAHDREIDADGDQHGIHQEVEWADTDGQSGIDDKDQPPQPTDLFEHTLESFHLAPPNHAAYPSSTS